MANSLCIIIGSISRNRRIRRYSELTKMVERRMPANTPGGATTFAHLLEEYRARAAGPSLRARGTRPGPRAGAQRPGAPDLLSHRGGAHRRVTRDRGGARRAP